MDERLMDNIKTQFGTMLISRMLGGALIAGCFGLKYDVNDYRTIGLFI